MQIMKAVGLVSAGVLTGVGALGMSVYNSAEASASVCGYSQEIRTYNSVLSLSLLNQSLDPFGGKKMVAVYGHCGKTNVRIKTESPNGSRYVCVPPGDSWLGFVNEGGRVTYAYYVGAC